MSNFKIPILSLLLLILISSCSISQEKKREKVKNHVFEDTKTEVEWKEILTPEEYYVLREKGTERAFTGDLWNNHEKGIFTCAACQQKLFYSDTKFESGTGWPSFYEPFEQDNILVANDNSFGMTRDEVVCSRCGGHLGHLFRDGPEPSGLRYCINSVSMDFVKESD
jgi:peptide-methionine (R)-S-oxide reductase